MAYKVENSTMMTKTVAKIAFMKKNITPITPVTMP